MSRDVLAAKLRNITATNAAIVVTSSASCLTQLAAGLRRMKSNVEVLHVSEFLLRALRRR